MDFYTYPHRTMCSVLEDMRNCDKTKNYAPLAGLIEELQVMGNRMEASLEDKHDVKSWTEERSKLKIEINKLRQESDKLKVDLGKKK